MTLADMQDIIISKLDDKLKEDVNIREKIAKAYIQWFMSFVQPPPPPEPPSEEGGGAE